MWLLAAALFLTEPAPLDMPRAEGYRVTDNDVTYLEDRFNRYDLWVAQSVFGRWVDEDGRVFTLAEVRYEPPVEISEDTVVTRSDYYSSLTPIAHKKLKRVRNAIAQLMGLDLPEKPARPRQLPRHYDDLDYWEGTNANMIVAAYLPEKSHVWRLAVWQLAEGDDLEEKRKLFENEFLGEQALKLKWEAQTFDKLSEVELLRKDMRHAVAAYDAWHVSDADEFCIIDNLAATNFIVSLTNDLKLKRAEYAKFMPTPISVTNTLSVARIYRTREEYVDALGMDGESNLTWSAAYWSTQRRELVAFLPDGGEGELLKTIRHEAFHQYLSYATALMPTSPWLNEGYAQFAEGEPFAEHWSPDQIDEFAKLLPALMAMNYAEFYEGTDAFRALKYKLAFSLADFIEKGAPKVRFQPFKAVKENYIKALFATQDPVKATGAAFGNKDTFDYFVNEWKRYLKNM